MFRDCLSLLWLNFIYFPILWSSSKFYAAHKILDKINTRELDKNFLSHSTFLIIAEFFIRWLPSIY